MTSIQESHAPAPIGRADLLPAQEPGTGTTPDKVRSHGSPGLEIAAVAVDTAPDAAPGRISIPVDDTLAIRLHALAKKTPDAPATWRKVDGAFVARSCREYSNDVMGLAKGLVAIGAKPHEGVTIYSFNCPEFVDAVLASGSIGSMKTGAYPDLAPKGVAHTINNSESRIVFVQNARMFEKLAPVMGDLANVERFIIMQGEKPAHPKTMTMQELTQAGRDVPAQTVKEFGRALLSGDTDMLIYTSGTTGAPKGCELTPGNLTFTADTFTKLAKLTPADRTICYLRLAHIADHMFSIGGPVTSGMQVFFSNKDALPQDLRTVRPTIFFAVPLVWDEMATKIETRAAKVTGWKKKLAPTIEDIGRKAAQTRARGDKPTGLLFWLANRFVFKPALEGSGLDQVRFAVSGGGAMKPSTEDTLAKLGIPLLNAYGQSETAGIVACPSPGVWRKGTVGKAPDGVELKLSPKGEILVRGPNCFKGYYKNPEATAKAKQNGWVNTGDLGKIDSGFLSFGGRDGDTGKLASGEYVNPQPFLDAVPGGVVSDSAVILKDRLYPMAVILLNDKLAAPLASSSGKLHEDPAVVKAVRARITAANKTLEAPHMAVRDFIIVDRPLVAGEGGEINATGKLVPTAVIKAFLPQLEEKYARGLRGKKTD